MIEYESEYGQGDSCKYRVLDCNPKTGKPWHPPYCALSFELEPGKKIKCKNLGGVVTLNMTEKSDKYKKARHVTVNLCELGMNHQKPDRSIVNFLKGMFKRAK